MTKDYINVFTENGLTQLLQLWHAPRNPRTLDRRIIRSFLWTNDYQLGFASPRDTPTHSEVSMKRCNACDEEFANKYSFCPVDGTPLNALAAALIGQDQVVMGEFVARGDESSRPRVATPKRGEFKVTMIGGAGLVSRLATEVSFVIDQLQRAWPEFKRDPLGLSGRALIALHGHIKQVALAPNAVAGGVTAMLVVLSAGLALILLGPAGPVVPDLTQLDLDQPVVQIVTFISPDPNTPLVGTGVGAGSNGRVGLASGKGEGSAPEPKRASGGGGGGENNPTPQNKGAVPPPSDIPAPINPPLPNPALPLAGIDIDPALYRSSPASSFGDPRTNSTVASKGPGEGGGIGTGKGTGIGEGKGDGIGPGNDGNIGGGNKGPGGGDTGGGDGSRPDPRQIVPTGELTQRAKVISKPEAGYTEEARRTQVTGTVVLRVVFSLSGEVTNIRAIKPLPGGLTERAIAAAHQIRFVPAMRNGQPVSCYMQLEYNFNLY